MLLRIRPFALGLVLLGVPLCAAPASAADFPAISEHHENLAAVPGYPEAPAVVLYRNAHFTMMGALGSEAYSSLVVDGRVKLLTREGTDFGEVQVAHNDFVRLISFEGRTVLPDGRTVELPEDALFEQTVSGRKRWSLTTATFPALEPGAIIDYHYELRYESYSSFDPFYFQSEIPTLHAEIVYTIPDNVAAVPWGKTTFGKRFQSERQPMSRGQQIRVWMDDMPPVPDEVLSPPFEDLSSSFLLLPTAMVLSGQRLLLFETWRSACDLLDYSYSEVRRRDGRTRRRAKQLAEEAGGSREERARAIYRFVRDEIGTVALPGVFPRLGEALDEMLREKRADTAGKGLMLREMLDAAGFDAEMVWAAHRDYGMIDPSIANPNWFEKILVRVEVGGREVFLDPAEPGAGFGYLEPGLEGMPGVVYDKRKPEVVELPALPYEDNLRHATVELRVEDGGRLAGSGVLVLGGHHAGRLFRTETTSDGLQQALEEDLRARFPGYEVSEVRVGEEDRDAPRLEVTWLLQQLPEEVLGDQVVLLPSRPLGPIAQRFTQEPASRLTPVVLSFADRDRVDLTVRWPEGWRVEVLPETESFTNAAGTFATEVELDEEARRLRFRRRFDTVERSFAGGHAYTTLRDLYARTESGDDLELVLVEQ
ncbi:MAG: DUF3857 domain-containing protein [Acidobacteriota bacterium]|jgi:hypothetical protein